MVALSIMIIGPPLPPSGQHEIKDGLSEKKKVRKEDILPRDVEVDVNPPYGENGDTDTDVACGPPPAPPPAPTTNEGLFNCELLTVLLERERERERQTKKKKKKKKKKRATTTKTST